MCTTDVKMSSSHAIATYFIGQEKRQWQSISYSVSCSSSYFHFPWILLTCDTTYIQQVQNLHNIKNTYVDWTTAECWLKPFGCDPICGICDTCLAFLNFHMFCIWLPQQLAHWPFSLTTPFCCFLRCDVPISLWTVGLWLQMILCVEIHHKMAIWQ